MAKPNNPILKGLYQLWYIPDDDSDQDIQIVGVFDDLAQAMASKLAGEASTKDDGEFTITKLVEIEAHYNDVTIAVQGTVQNSPNRQ